jgi:hypothetical protein
MNLGALRSKIRFETNSRRIEYENSVTDYYRRFANEKIFRKHGASNLDRCPENNVCFTFHLIFYTMRRCLTGSLSVMKRGIFNTTRKQNARACSGKHRIYLGRKSTHVSLAAQDHALRLYDHKGIVHYEFVAQG